MNILDDHDNDHPGWRAGRNSVVAEEFLKPTMAHAHKSRGHESNHISVKLDLPFLQAPPCKNETKYT